MSTALFRIIPQNVTGKVLEVQNGSNYVGAPIVMNNRRDSDFDSQLWIFDNQRRIKNKKSGLFLSIRGPDISRQPVIQGEKDVALHWTFNHDDNTIRLINSGLVLDVKDRGTKDNTEIIIHTRNIPTPNDPPENLKHQQFTLEFYRFDFVIHE
ncbi:hypothetical protein RclHR1_02190007 [Rhizophagus clarus]|uniref:Carbohydrate-binding module family 13 protein n=1 Tax=Rhizophagus clarus TaxID=94130 RepID=A0A2Z6QY81_9GLOM|nr:hypothetical protein RclHR1_02190007 [Rhizophagus clarus]GES73662.1 carbohydrate-binding module family 13 protein [Rhizophagus clarus]